MKHECRPNLLPNSGFERVASAGLPAGWRWDRRNTDAACATGHKVFLEAEEAQTVVQGDGPFSVAFTLSNPRAVTGAFSAGWGSWEPVRQTISLAAGVWRVLVKGESAAASDARCALTLRLEEANQESTAASAPVGFFSAANALQRLGALKASLPALKADLQAVKSRGQDPSYPAVTATVLENFIGYAEEDARHGEVRRSLEQVGDLERMASRLGGELKEALAGQRQFPAVPRWTGDQRPVIRRSSFVAPACLPGGVPQERPVFFTGYGHFSQVVSDMEKWPDYGVNIIQRQVPSRRRHWFLCPALSISLVQPWRDCGSSRGVWCWSATTTCWAGMSMGTKDGPSSQPPTSSRSGTVPLRPGSCTNKSWRSFPHGTCVPRWSCARPSGSPLGAWNGGAPKQPKGPW